MRRTQVLLTITVTLLMSVAALAQDAQSILAKAREMQLARWEGVKNYTVEQTTAGPKMVFYYERVNETSFRVVPQSELQRRLAAADGAHSMTPEEVAAIADRKGDGAIADFDDIQELAKTAKVLRTKTIGDGKGYHRKADSVDHVQDTGDQTIDFDTFEI